MRSIESVHQPVCGHIFVNYFKDFFSGIFVDRSVVINNDNVSFLSVLHLMVMHSALCCCYGYFLRVGNK